MYPSGDVHMSFSFIWKFEVRPPLASSVRPLHTHPNDHILIKKTIALNYRSRCANNKEQAAVHGRANKLIGFRITAIVIPDLIRT